MYQVLIVAEQYQTGFDLPLLHLCTSTSWLSRLAAVQTLSRLNRYHPLKCDRFVLDFRNEADDIVKALEPYYPKTAAPPTDPNPLADTRERLDEFDVLQGEMEAVLPALLQVSLTRKLTGRCMRSLLSLVSGSGPSKPRIALAFAMRSASSSAFTACCQRW